MRLIGVDTPEVRAPAECCGRAATGFAERFAGPGTRVRLAFDVEREDRYGRTLAYVSRARDGRSLNEALVRRGYATPLTVPPNVRRAARLPGYVSSSVF